MSKISRDKGKRGEREVCTLLQELGFNAKRGANATDVISNFPFHIEVKLQNKLGIFSAIDQAEGDAKGKPYMIIFRKDRGKWHACIEWDFMKQFVSK